MRYVLFAAACAILGACSHQEVVMRHPETGDTATCSQTTNLGNAAVAAVRVEQCVEDYQARGYQRVDR